MEMAVGEALGIALTLGATIAVPADLALHTIPLPPAPNRPPIPLTGCPIGNLPIIMECICIIDTWRRFINGIMSITTNWRCIITGCTTIGIQCIRIQKCRLRPKDLIRRGRPIIRILRSIQALQLP